MIHVNIYIYIYNYNPLQLFIDVIPQPSKHNCVCETPIEENITNRLWLFVIVCDYLDKALIGDKYNPAHENPLKKKIAYHIYI